MYNSIKNIHRVHTQTNQTNRSVRSGYELRDLFQEIGEVATDRETDLNNSPKRLWTAQHITRVTALLPQQKTKSDSSLPKTCGQKEGNTLSYDHGHDLAV